MATSSDTGGKRPSVKSSGKTEKQSRKTRGDDSDKICGFHPLRSLRNIFFGYRRRETPSEDKDVETTPKAKSTDDIAEQIHRQQVQQPTRAIVRSPVIAANSANPIRKGSRTSIPMVKQLSKSADNLVSPADWIPAPHGIPSAVNSPCGSADSNLNASTDEIDYDAALDPNSVDEFFVDKWSQVHNSRTRAFSSGDAEEVGQETTFDLDSVNQTKALDVSVAKNRISIKPKGKRATVAMQQKMFRAEALPKPTKTYHLQSLSEDNEDEDEEKREQKGDASAAAAAIVKALATPDPPIRREKKQVPNTGVRMTISITPDMLIAPRKKVSASGNNNIQSSTTNHRHNNGPPPPTCPKKRRTTIEPEGRTGVQDKKKEEEPAKNGATLGGSMTRRPLLSVKEDEVAGEEDGEVARPKAPPRVRPKTRPKTMMHAPAPQTTEPEPEWVTRAKKKNALVE